MSKKLKTIRLTECSKLGDLDRVKWFASKGANVRHRKDRAIREACRYGHFDVVKYLHEQGADIEAVDGYGLRWASKKGFLDIVKYLVSEGADITSENSAAIRWASQKNQDKVVEFLIESLMKQKNIESKEIAPLLQEKYWPLLKKMILSEKYKPEQLVVNTDLGL